MAGLLYPLSIKPDKKSFRVGTGARTPTITTIDEKLQEAAAIVPAGPKGTDVEP
jgi:hypothetical protein